MKIIFCDIDGVLNSEYGSKVGFYDVGGIEERKIKQLKKIIEATGAKVVISSRANSFMGKEFDEMRVNSIKSLGVTPLDSITDIEYQESKATAIKRWLRKHPGVENFVVFDDCESDLEMAFSNKFIYVNGKHGLTYRLANKAIEILNKEK